MTFQATMITNPIIHLHPQSHDQHKHKLQLHNSNQLVIEQKEEVSSSEELLHRVALRRYRGERRHRIEVGKEGRVLLLFYLRDRQFRFERRLGQVEEYWQD